MPSTFAIDLSNTVTDVTDVGPLSLRTGVSYHVQNVGAGQLEYSLFPSRATQTEVPGSWHILPIRNTVDVSIGARQGLWIRSGSGKGRIAVTELNTSGQHGGAASEGGVVTPETNAETVGARFGRKFTVEEDDTLVVDCRAADSDIIYAVQTASGGTVTKRVALLDFPRTADYLATGENDSVSASSVEYGRERFGISWLRFAADGADATVWVSCVGSLSYHESATNVTNRADTDLADRSVKVARSVVVPRSVLLAPFEYYDPDVLIVSAVSGTPGNATVAVDSSGNLTITGVAVGSSTITVTATAPAGDTASETFDVTVQANAMPVAYSDPLTLSLRPTDTYELDLRPYFTDADDPTLSYSAASDETSVATVAVSGESLVITAVAAGDATITITATDSASQTVDYTLTVNVAASNADVLRHTQRLHGVRFEHNSDDPSRISLLNLLVSGDPEEVAYTSATSTDESVATAVLDQLSEVVISPVGPGEAAIHVTATQTVGNNVVTHDLVIPVIVGNRAPVIFFPFPSHYFTPIRFGSYQPLRITLSEHFRDPDSDPLTYELHFVSGDLSLMSDISNGILTFTVRGRAYGNLASTFQITARDGNGGMVQTNIRIQNYGRAT